MRCNDWRWLTCFVSAYHAHESNRYLVIEASNRSKIWRQIDSRIFPRRCCRTFTSSGDHWQRPILVRFSVLYDFCACELPLPSLTHATITTWDGDLEATLDNVLTALRGQAGFVLFFFGGVVLTWFWGPKNGYNTNMKKHMKHGFWMGNKMNQNGGTSFSSICASESPGEVGRCRQSWCNMQDSAEPIPCCSTGSDYWIFREWCVFFCFFLSNGVNGV